MYKLNYIIVVNANYSHLRINYFRKIDTFMKRIIKIIVASLIIVLMFIGGGYSIYYFSKPSENKKVIATIFPIYDITRNIMGSADDILFLEDSGADIHNFQPTAHDMTSISKCELFIFIGGESDKWVGKVLETTDNVNLKTLQLLDEIEKLEESDEGILDSHVEGSISPMKDSAGLEVEENIETLISNPSSCKVTINTNNNASEDNAKSDIEESEDIEYDEHIWLSIKNAIKMTTSIKNSLCQVFPERSEIFKKNAQNYIEKLNNLEKEYESVCSNKEDTLIIADRFPFLYLTKDYNIKYHACFSGCSTDTQASAETMSKLIDKINTCNVEYILTLESSDQSVANSAINDARCKSGVKIDVLNSCQSVSDIDADKTSYIDIMYNNLSVLRKVLKNEFD